MQASEETRGLILSELDRLYPNPEPELEFLDPYQTLVSVMLSAQCTDKQVNKVTPELFRRYPDVETMAAASAAEVYPLVKSCGFKSKADNIVEACRILLCQHSGEVPRDMDALRRLPGVGRKTANVVMACAFGEPAIPVDTHVFRVSNRLGLADAKDVEKTEEQLQRAIPRDRWIDAHHWLIFHGRRVCHARKPDCANCTLSALCRSAELPVLKTVAREG